MPNNHCLLLFQKNSWYTEPEPARQRPKVSFSFEDTTIGDVESILSDSSFETMSKSSTIDALNKEVVYAEVVKVKGGKPEEAEENSNEVNCNVHSSYTFTVTSSPQSPQPQELAYAEISFQVDQ